MLKCNLECIVVQKWENVYKMQNVMINMNKDLEKNF